MILAQACLAGLILSSCSVPLPPSAAPVPVSPTSTAVPLLPTSPPSPNPSATPSAAPTATPEPALQGKIVWTCQVYAQELHDQICLENADRTGFLQLTTDPAAENYYPSFAPDGKSVVYVSNRSGEYEIYELDLATRTRLQLTHNLGEVSGPAISPDGSWIVFADNVTAFSSIWKMRRDGSGPHQVFARQGEDAVDPSWSPDGTQILFALGGGTDKQLYTIHPDGTGLHRVNADFRTRGRSSWSPDGTQIASYAGSPWNWGMYLIAEDGSGVLRIPVDGVALAPAFSPDGSWIVFTGYLDHPGDPDGCEIYVMRLNGSQPSRMTYNNYCDYQPRWGP